MIDNVKLRKRIKNFIIENSLNGFSEATLGDSDSFLEKGIVDSTGILELVAFVEEEFGIEVRDEEIDSAVAEGKMEQPWQYFAVLLDTKSVGVMGDIRAYKRTVVVRSVQSVDAMTAAYSQIPHSVLERISTRITNELKDEVNRVVYDITNKPPGTIEWE